MSKILFTIVALCLAQAVFGRVARESAVTPSPLDAGLTAIETFVAQAHDSVLKVIGVSSDAELWESLKTQFTSTAQQWRANAASLEEHLKPLRGEAEQAVKALSVKVSEAATNFGREHPEFQDVNKFQDAAEKNIKSIAESVQNVRAKLEAEGQNISPQLEATLKSIVDNTAKAAEEFKTKAQSAVSAIQKKL